MHPRVVNVLHQGAEWDVYVGRGRCPCSLRPCPHQVRVLVGELSVRIDWSNPYPIDAYGPACMRMFLDHVAPSSVAQARLYLPDLRLGCWCRGRYPVCHAEVWARLADGEELAAIRADVLGRLSAVDETKRKVREAALRVACPHCGANPGVPCVAAFSARPARPHARRVDAAREAGLWSVS